MEFTFFKSASAPSAEEIEGGGDFKSFFADYRKNKVARPDLMIKRGMQALKARGNEGVDKWSLLETLFVAAIDVGDGTLASYCLKELEKEFPDSVRVGVLKGRKMELEGKFSDAMALYNDLQKKQLHNIDVMRRLVCVHKQSGNSTLAVEHLHKLLAVYPSDTAAWFELSEIHLAYGEYVLCYVVLLFFLSFLFVICDGLCLSLSIYYCLPVFSGTT
jgi:hypothetical protein